MTTTMTAPTSVGASLTAGGIVRSEWIKLRTVRSTMWCYGLLMLLLVAVGALVSSLANLHDLGGPGGAPLSGTTITGDVARSLVVGINTGALNVAVLIVAVLGALIITGEYSTGMIRSTFAAAPHRTGALAAKAAVLAVTAFLATVVGVWLSALVSWPILAGKGVTVELGTPSVFLPLLGGGVYIAMIALLAFGFGTILKSTAGALATIFGIIMVAPIILQLISSLTHAKWVTDITSLLPQNAGSHLFAYSGVSEFARPDAGGLHLGGWGGFAVLLAWDVVILAIALIRVKRRDA